MCTILNDVRLMAVAANNAIREVRGQGEAREGEDVLSHRSPLPQQGRGNCGSTGSGGGDKVRVS